MASCIVSVCGFVPVRGEIVVAEPLYALSLRQPWAYAVLHLGKDIENRPWRSRFRGRVILHASKTLDRTGVQSLREAGLSVPDELPLGAYVGEVTITDCRSLADCSSRWAFGPWCYLLEHPRAYSTPIPGRGQLGFYRLPEEVARLLGCSRPPEEVTEPLALFRRSDPE
jgi:hypothetical protein